MTTLSVHQRRTPFIAAAAAVAAIAAGSVALSVSHDASDPGPQPPITHVQSPRGHHFEPTTSGGRTMVGP
jgi:hypothetical protein